MKLRLHGKDITEVELEAGREYTFGRGSNCDFVLEPEAGISRTHFRLFEDNGLWTVQVLSKFGEVLHGGAPTGVVVLENGSNFELAGYSFQFLESSSSNHAYSVQSGLHHENFETPSQVAVGQSHSSQAAVANSLVVYTPSDAAFEGNVELTQVGSSLAGQPHLRMIERSGEEQTLKLEGKNWVAGREDGCEILLNDRKASRRQFELSASPQGFFIRDLGSSNGTVLNGVVLASDELRPLRSGDLIVVGKLKMHFEVRDPNFERKLMVIPPEVMTAPQLGERDYEMINFPVPQGSGGAVRYIPPGSQNLPSTWKSWADFKNADVAQKKKIRFYMILAAVVLVFGAIYFSGGSKPTKAPVEANSPFARLTAQKQQVVRETYILAKNLFIQGKWDLAASQIQKLHEILPDGYEESRTIADKCREAIANAERVADLYKQQRIAEENKRTVEQTIHNCQSLANSTMNVGDLRGCLSKAYDLDPENPLLTQMVSGVELRIEARNHAKSEQADHEERVARGRALFTKAEILEKQGKVFEAMEAYKKHIDSTLPDPANLKSVSQKNLLSISKRISSKVDESLVAAEAAFKAQNYKEAIEKIKVAKGLDPTNEKAAQLNATVRRDLNMKLKDIYEESIINEGLGKLDPAKDLWKKIIDTDHPDGDYYHKAKSKLKAYGSF
jgi:pSer/pThr/pTyr-binding forkhead associated (FHA) protein/tetratricopeptide (TPR) repeat protein